MSAPRPTPKVTFSNLNVLKSRYSLHPVNWLGDFSQGAGLDGLEYAPTWDRIAGHTVEAIRKAVERDRLRIVSFHANFRLHDRWAPQEGKSLLARALDSPLGRVAMAPSFRSTQLIGKMQQALPEYVPTVLYPCQDAERDNRQISQAGSYALLQPTDQTANQMGARNIVQYDALIRGRRQYRGYVIDTSHIREQFGQARPGMVSNLENSLPVLAAYAYGVHISVGRYDIKKEPQIDTAKDLATALSGDYAGTPIGDILDGLKESASPIEYIAIEAPIDAVASATGYSRTADLQQAYGDIGAGIRAYMS